MPQIKSGSTTVGQSNNLSSISHVIKGGVAGDTQVVIVNASDDRSVSSISENGYGAWTSRVASSHPGGSGRLTIFTRLLAGTASDYTATITLSGSASNVARASLTIDGEYDTQSAVLTSDAWTSSHATNAMTAGEANSLALYVVAAGSYNRTWTVPSGIALAFNTATTGGPDFVVASADQPTTLVAAQTGATAFSCNNTEQHQSVVLTFVSPDPVGGLIEGIATIPEVGSITLSPTSLLMSVGDVVTVSVTVRDQYGSPLPNANLSLAIKPGSPLSDNANAATPAVGPATDSNGATYVTMTGAQAGSLNLDVSINGIKTTTLPVNVQSAPTVNAPIAPSGTTATAAGSNAIVVNWTDNSGNEIGFRVRLKTSAGGAAVQSADVAAGVTTYTFTGLSANTHFWVDVCALGSTSNSAFTPEADATTATTANVFARFTTAAVDLAGNALAGTSGWRAVVWTAPNDAGLVGTEIAEVTGLSFEAALSSGEAVLKVPLSASVAVVGQSVRGLLQDATRTTGVISGTVTT